MQNVIYFHYYNLKKLLKIAIISVSVSFPLKNNTLYCSLAAQKLQKSFDFLRREKQKASPNIPYILANFQPMSSFANRVLTDVAAELSDFKVVNKIIRLFWRLLEDFHHRPQQPRQRPGDLELGRPLVLPRSHVVAPLAHNLGDMSGLNFYCHACHSRTRVSAEASLF